MNRIYNFSPGPAALPVPVLEEAARGVLEFGGSGMSVLEVSHRGKQFEAIHQDAKSRLLRIMGLESSDYTVIFLGGGASLQFHMLPLNYAQGATAAYADTGHWSVRAIEEASRLCDVAVVASGEASGYTAIPAITGPLEGARYLHITSNNTIEGTEWPAPPDSGDVALVADASSDFLARAEDYSRYSLLYAGAQKNLGPAGVTVVVARRAFIADAADGLPAMLSYRTHEKHDSLYNTPPVFGVYVVCLVLGWIEAQGGLPAIEAENRAKAGAVYDALDAHPDVYEAPVQRRAHRSLMNVTFRLRDASREAEFLVGAEQRGMDGLKGHRSVGGFRASIYNAFPREGAMALADYLGRFARR
ncbi:MAG TPA: 3-phosphoserine/phosphohydroxythreonine transaminase [Chthonomonadales bacterium]|nr:3-phosphoserine/phosphohydroxythreonine transaminase [Chthonomonadales bacterium]